ncbi:MAG: DUF4388 domain-containing protein [Myxococcota bacterium]
MEYEQRELAYSDLRLFVSAYREAISQGLVALPWADAPEKGAHVRIALTAPFMERSIQLIGEVSERRDAGVVIALQPLGSNDSFELDAHVALCEGVMDALRAAIQDYIGQGDAWSGLQIQPCTGTLDAGRVSAASGLQHVVVNVDALMPYLYLHRTHLENRELFIQMSTPVDARSVLHVHLGLPYLGTEVELRGVVARVLSDGIFIDLAPYPRSTRRLFEWYWRFVEQAAAEVTADLAKVHGQVAVNAIRALLPRASEGIGDVVGDVASSSAEEAATEEAPEVPPEEVAAETTEAAPVVAAPAAPVVAEAPVATAPPVPPEPVAPTLPKAEPEPVAPAPPKAEPDMPNIFTRRRALGGRGRGKTTPTMDAVVTNLESSLAVSQGGTEDAAPGAPVIPVLLGDGGGKPRSDPYETLTSFERKDRPSSAERQTLSRVIGRGSSQLGSSSSTRQRGAVATSDFVAPPVPESPPEPAGPPTLKVDGEPSAEGAESHSDIGLFRRPSNRTRAKTIPPVPASPAADMPPPAVSTPAEEPPAPEPVDAAPASPVSPPPERVIPVAPPPPSRPEPAPAPAAAVQDDVDEDDLIEDDLSTPLRPPSGSFKERPLVEVLGELYRHNATGALKIKGESRTTTLSFRKGRVTHIAETPEDEAALMGTQFVTLGVSKHEISRAVNQSKSEKKLIGHVLLESGTIVKSQVKQALISQLKIRIGSIDGLETAEYEYVDGQGVRRSDAPNVDPVKLLFRGRFEHYMNRSKRENQVESHSYSGSFVRQRNRGRRWLNRFGLSLPQQGAWELIESGELKLSQLFSKLSVDQTTVCSTLFALRDFGCLEFKTKKQEEQTREAIEKRFQEKMDVLRTGNQFDILDVHWTSTEVEVQKGYDHSLQSFDLKYIDAPSELMRTLSREILPAVEEAYELLKSKRERVAYRESITTPDQVRTAAEHLVEQGDMELFKNDLRLAREKFRRAIELMPSDKKIKRKLNDTFTISGQAAAQSQTKVEHKPAATFSGDD